MVVTPRFAGALRYEPNQLELLSFSLQHFHYAWVKTAVSPRGTIASNQSLVSSEYHMNPPASLSGTASRFASPTGAWLTRKLPVVSGVIGLLALVTGCVEPTAPTAAPRKAAATATEPIPEPAKSKEVFTLQEGDVVKISFPGAKEIDTTQAIRRDGKISLAMVGEVVAIGRTPTELEQDLLKLYANQLVSKEVNVLVVSSSYAVFVSGAVLRPGKIMADRPLTPLEAVMEAGGFDSAKADMTAVKVVRQEEGGTKNFTLDLKLILEGKSSEPFFLKKSDIIFVPEKRSIF